MNNYLNNTRSMNGLNNINANSGTFEEIDVNTLVVNTSGTAPTIADPLDYSDNIATTEWVTNHAGVGYVTINTSQTLTGEKTFSNANTIVSGNLITNSIRSSSGTTDINIGQNLTTGDINMGTTFIGPTMNVALNWGSSSNSGNLSLRGGSFTLASTGNYNQSSGASFQTNISTNQSDGVMAIGTLNNRSGIININTGGTSTAPINISSGTNTNAPITIGSTASTTQTCDMNAITNFSKIPSCAITATSSNELVNLSTLNGAITTAGADYAKLATPNTFTSTNTFNTNLPTSTITATSANELVNLSTLNGAITTAGGSYVTLAGVPQLITGDKTFNGYVDFLSLEASIITNTGGIFTPNIGSIIATDPISIVPSQSSGTCNIATFGTRTGTINLGTGTSGKTMNIGGTATTTNINSLRTTISTSSTSGNSLTHSSTTTSGDDLRLTATGGYLARIGEGSSSDGLTILGVDSGTSIIKATTSSLEIRADAGLTFTGTIGSNNTFSGTNTYTGTTSFQNNVTVQAGNTVRYGSRSVGSPSGIDLGQTNVNEITLKLVTTADDFIFRTSGGLNMMTFDNFGITASFPFAMYENFLINQSAYTSMGTTQLGYTIQKTFGPSVLGDTTGTFTLVGSGQALGTNTGVYLITCGFELTNSGSDTVNNKALCLSLSSASGTPVNAYGAWEYYEEINDSMGSAGTRYIGTLTGVYTKTTTSAQTLYLNGYANTSGSQTISATGYCSITRIG
jgi:hypothetical protein